MSTGDPAEPVSAAGAGSEDRPRAVSPAARHPAPATTAGPTPFTGRIVHNRDGSLVLVAADVPWVSEPDSIVDDGSGRAQNSASAPPPPPIRSVLFIRRRRAARADRTEPGAPPGLIVDRYRVCDADGGADGSVGGSVGGSGSSGGSVSADVACGAADAAPEVSSSAPGRTNITCCVCRLCFGAAPAFAVHCVNAHGLPLDAARLRFLARPEAAAVLAVAGADRQPAVSLLRFSPCPSDATADGTASTQPERSVTESGECAAQASRQEAAPCDSVGAGVSPLESPSAGCAEISGVEEDGDPTSSVSSSVPAADTAPSQSDASRPPSASSLAASASSLLKTLKCPRCNWHFKYRDTLEVHLREKHPEGGSACCFCLSGQPHPRLSRGEVHDCGYKPYRCDICHYATTTKGNLSIHMQSDKHLNNAQDRHRAIHTISALGDRTAKEEVETMMVGSTEDSADGEEKPHLSDLVEANFVQARLKALSDTAAIRSASDAGSSLADKIAMWFSNQQNRSIQDDKLSSAMQYDDAPKADVPSDHLNPRHIFTCCTCAAFSTDSLDELEQHVRRDRGGARAGDFTAVEGGVQVCLLCSYRTHLRANFLLHCQSDKHVQKQQHLLHILEGGAGNLWQLPYLHAASPGAVRCNLCEVSAGLGVQLRVHAAEGRHQASRALWTYLRSAGRDVPASRRRYGCSLCGYSARHLQLLLRHAAGLLHLSRERRRLTTGQPPDSEPCFSVRDAGSDADEPDEVYESTEDHPALRQLGSHGLETNGTCTGSAPDVPNLDVIRLRQLDPGIADGQSHGTCNGLTNHEQQPNGAPDDLSESKGRTEKSLRVDGEGKSAEAHRKAKCDSVLPEVVMTAKTSHSQKLKTEYAGRKVDGIADQNDNVDSVEDNSRRFKCHVCNVSYGHPEILSIHLQSASHRARVSAENTGSSETESKRQTGSVRVSEALFGLGKRKADGGDESRGSAVDADRLSSLPIGESQKLTDEVTILAVRRGDGDHGRTPKLDERGNENERTMSHSRYVISISKPSPIGREALATKDRLLESYGLELAMHHCEVRRKRRKLDGEGSEKTADSNAADASSEGSYLCPLCHKTFSGLWIFKHHVEEIHHKYVPRELLEKHIEAISKELHQRRKISSNAVRSDAESRTTDASKTARTECQTTVERASPAPSRTGSGDTAKPSTHPETSRASSPPAVPQLPMPDLQTALSLIQAAHIRYQMQQLNPLLASQMAALGAPLSAFGLGDASSQSQQLLSLMAAQQLLNPSVLWAAQAQALAQQQQQQQQAQQQQEQQQRQQAQAQQQQASTTASSKPTDGMRPSDSSATTGSDEKRARTRINGYQLKMLRAHFEVDRTPSDEIIRELGRQCDLAPKVVKHWFRNTLFKERQRDKDSPYNFSVPPSAPLELSQHSLRELSAIQADQLRSSPLVSKADDSTSESRPVKDDSREAAHRASSAATASEDAVAVDLSNRTPSLSRHLNLPDDLSHSSPLPSLSPPPAHNGSRSSGSRLTGAFPSGLSWSAPVTREYGELSITLPSRSPFQQSPSPGSSSSTAYGSPMWSELSPPEGQKSGGSRRANRTRFTDQQVKVLQDFFEKNAYPKEDDLRHLSKTLNLGPRVIVVWFQNARQKVRKVFENQPPTSEPEEKASRFQRTAELNYQCNRCKLVYQRYQELLRHQRQHCYREESAKQRGKSQERRSESGTTASPAPVEVKPTPEDNTYKCGKCPQEFDRFDRWREHQVVHVMNPSVVPSSRQNQCSGGSPAASPSARPSHSAEEASGEETDDASVWDRHAQDRRLRTSINPEQIQLLQRTYKLNSTPSRETLEMIANGTGLKKRVVQVWFQNARARERKSQGVRQMPVSVTYSSPTETIVKTKVTEPKLGPEVSVELVKTYSKVMPSALVQRENDPRDVRVSEFAAMRHPVLEARLQAAPVPAPAPAADAPLDLSKSQTPAPPAASKPPPPRVMPPAARRDIPQLNALPLLPPREGIPWTSRPVPELAPTSAPPPAPNARGGPAAPSPFAVANKRFRTQMSPGQVSVLRSVFAAYRMPTMAECARLGAEIGLAKRVVQVWFQNSRAKEKKRQLQSGRPPTPPPQACELCHVTYGVKCSLQEHLLSRAHIERVQREAERTRAAPPAAGGSGSSGAAAASAATAPPPRSSSAVNSAASSVRPGPPSQLTKEPAGGAAVKAPLLAAAVSALQRSPPAGTATSLRGAPTATDGASGPPRVSIGDATCDPASRPPAVGAAAAPMATSVG